MINGDRKQKQGVIFLFGAGASVDAGVPDTYRFVEEFKRHVEKEDSKLHGNLLQILEKREQFNERNFGVQKRQVDVEQLLGTLGRLIEQDRDPLLDFFDQKRFSPSLSEDWFPELKRLLEDFIRKNAVVEKEERLDYLRELLQFDTPLEMYSTNYDTCIEQLCHTSHRRYVDGFDVYWNPDSFDEDSDVKHFELRGSVIWYENKKTKEYVKIPVRGFINEKKVDLRLIYGEDVEPLLIYPAQKPEYIEPLTELQLMFKRRLTSNETRTLIVVGYSFRDDYIVHMLWDAARINHELHVIFISPSAQKQFEDKLMYVDKEKKILSRISDRVLCLPYPFSTVINSLRNHYLPELERIRGLEKRCVESERYGNKADWQSLLRECIDGEFSTKTEHILKERLRMSWHELSFTNPQDQLLYGVKGLLHSVIAKDGHEDEWLERVNASLRAFSIDNLRVSGLNTRGFDPGFAYPGQILSFNDVIQRWIDPVLDEIEHKRKLLGPRSEKALEKIEESFTNLTGFRQYLTAPGRRIRWDDYLKLRSMSKEEQELIGKVMGDSLEPKGYPEVEKQVLSIEGREMKKSIGGETCQLRLQKLGQHEGSH